jgi:hypothetical protein
MLYLNSYMTLSIVVNRYCLCCGSAVLCVINFSAVECGNDVCMLQMSINIRCMYVFHLLAVFRDIS